MKKLVAILLLVMLLSLVGVTVASASHGDSVGGCPGKFELHHAMNHDDHHGHQHVGSDTDHNNDGWICVKHVSSEEDIHVHIDNRVPLSD